MAKVARDKQADIAEKQAAVVSYLAQLPELLDTVRKLMGKSPQSQSRFKPRDLRDPAAAVLTLRSNFELQNLAGVR